MPTEIGEIIARLVTYPFVGVIIGAVLTAYLIPKINKQWRKPKELELKNKEEYKFLSDFLNSNSFAVQFDGIYKTRHTQHAVLKTFFDYNESLIDYVTNILYSTYSSNSDSAQKATTIYSPLLTLVNDNRIDIFTTNYDSVIEQYCKKSLFNIDKRCYLYSVKIFSIL